MTIRGRLAEKKQIYIRRFAKLLLVAAVLLGMAFIFRRIGTNATLEILRIFTWPAVALTALAIVRPHLSHILSGAKVKLTVYGQSIETTLPELRQILEEQSGEELSDEHISYLENLLKGGPKHYPEGITESADRKFLRPLRNGGLVFASPRNAFLKEARVIEISGLGRLLLRARAETGRGTNNSHKPKPVGSA